MRKTIHNLLKPFVILFLIGVFFTSSSSLTLAKNTQKVKETFQPAEGVNYQYIQMKNGSLTQAIRVLETDLSVPNTSIQLGYPNSLDTLQKTTTQALNNHREGNYVVGAINGSFFDLYEIVGSPMNLVAKDNILIHAGEVYTGDRSKFVNEPIAFGITDRGKAVIDEYHLQLSYIHNGDRYEITSTNKVRKAGETILYTPSFPENDTDTNEWGAEIAVELPSKPVLAFGTSLTGVVVDKRAFMEKREMEIPDNGFVISVHGAEKAEQLDKIQLGDEITLQVDIDDQWKDAAFMLASGPMLVKDGKKYITMDVNSKNATGRHPRTAVAIDKSGEHVFFVTVDGRQPGYSNGMTLSEFADYLVDLGVDRALNLDGGGSTTMAVRYFGSDKIALANQPSDGFERGVWSMLMAVTSEPVQIFADVPSDYWASKEITEMFYEKVITGYPDGNFLPNQTLTRREAAIMLTRAFQLDTGHVTDPGFTDVEPTDPYYKEIAAATNAGLFQGRGGGRFDPDEPMERAEMATVIYRALQLPKTDNSYFQDVDEDYWGFVEINSLGETGIAKGYSDGTFKPNKEISRAEFTTFLFRGLSL